MTSFLFLVISRYGEVVDINLVRDKGTGKSKGFAFVAYEDQRSTNLAVGSSLCPVILNFIFYYVIPACMEITKTCPNVSFVSNCVDQFAYGRHVRGPN